MPDSLTLGRDAIERHNWDEALAALTESDQRGELSPDDLRMLGDAYWWSAEPDKAVEAYERAFSGFMKAERIDDAAATGALLAYFALRRQNEAIAGAWVSRVEGLLEDQPIGAGHAWLALLYTALSLFQVELDAALEKADETIEIAKEVKLRGIEALAMSFKGMALIQQGQWREGVTLIDQATVVAISEGGDLRAAADVYCNTIAACAGLGDFRRAGEWTEEAERWMHSNSVGGYTGVCQVHRAELKRFRGSWSEAEETARNACVELERFRILDGIGFARYEIGEVRRRMGDLEAAEEAFQQAYEYGHAAQPGYALLLLDKGDVEGAKKSIDAALSARGGDDWNAQARLGRARLLPAQVEVALAAEDVETARAALDELRQVAEDYDSSLWEGYALACEGSVDLYEGHADEALDVLKRSWVIWRDSDMPYESAKARVLLGMARQATGDETGAAMEFNAARSTFERLGAARDLEQLRELTGESVSSGPAGDRVTKTFMFTDIVTSTDLIGLIGDSAWENLLKWHDRTLREAIESHRGEEVRHTGDGFFIAFANPRSAIECGVAIQRRLERHRRDHGFAPWVRIGIHQAEASREKGDYSGGGVHVAARIGDTAGREEILVSEDLLAAVGQIPYQASEPREVNLKGVSESVKVRSIEWR